jgi:hypothetical protein
MSLHDFSLLTISITVWDANSTRGVYWPYGFELVPHLLPYWGVFEPHSPSGTIMGCLNPPLHLSPHLPTFWSGMAIRSSCLRRELGNLPDGAGPTRGFIDFSLRCSKNRHILTDSLWHAGFSINIKQYFAHDVHDRPDLPRVSRSF